MPMKHDPPRPWITLATEVLGSYPIFELSRSRQRSPSSGREHRFLRLDCPDWVNVIAVTPDRRLSRYDKHGRRLWTVKGRFHHGLWLDGDEIYALTRVGRVIEDVHSRIETLEDLQELKVFADGHLTGPDLEGSPVARLHDARATAADHREAAVCEQARGLFRQRVVQLLGMRALRQRQLAAQHQAAAAAVAGKFVDIRTWLDA